MLYCFIDHPLTEKDVLRHSGGPDPYTYMHHCLGKFLETTKMNKKRHVSRGRLAAGRAQEEFEQAVKGGFERIFPPSQSAPNARANYTKVLALALSRQSTVVIGVFVHPLDRL